MTVNPKPIIQMKGPPEWAQDYTQVGAEADERRRKIFDLMQKVIGGISLLEGHTEIQPESLCPSSFSDVENTIRMLHSPLKEIFESSTTEIQPESLCPSSFSDVENTIKMLHSLETSTNETPLIRGFIEEYRAELSALQSSEEWWLTDRVDFKALPEEWQLLLRSLETTSIISTREDFVSFSGQLLNALALDVIQSYPNPENPDVKLLSSIINTRYERLFYKSVRKIVSCGSYPSETRMRVLLGSKALGVCLHSISLDEGKKISKLWDDAERSWFEWIKFGLPFVEALEYINKLPQLRQEIEKIKEENSGSMWRCNAVIMKRNGELTLGFQIDPEYLDPQAFVLKNEEIYPALEPLEAEISVSLTAPNPHGDQILMKLGYAYTVEDGRATLWLPDIKQLHANLKSWGYNDIRIVGLEGTSGDKEVVKAYLENDFVLLDGKKFINHHMLLLVPGLRKIFGWDNGSSFKYKDIREWIRSNIMEKIDVIEAMENLIGSVRTKECTLNEHHIKLYWGALAGWVALQINKIARPSIQELPFPKIYLVNMVEDFEIHYNHFGPEAKEKYSPLEHKDFMDLKELLYAVVKKVNEGPST